MDSTSAKPESRCILVAGGSGVIGQAIAQEFGEHQWHVGVQYNQNYKAAQDTVRFIQTSGGTSTIYQANIQDLAQTQNMVQRFIEEHQQLHALIWAIGISESQLLVRTTSESWHKLMTTNLTGCFQLLKAAAPVFSRQRHGSVVLIGSFSGAQGKTGQTAYAASKAGLIGLMKSVAKEWAPWNIRINAVFPGWHRSPLSGKFFPHSEELESHVFKTTPAISDVAAAVYQLVTMEGISGQIWNMDSRVG